MFANKINYNKETSIIELEHNVKIIRDGETIEIFINLEENVGCVQQ